MDYARYSCFGLKALLARNGLQIIQHEKLGADVSILYFQLTNAYLYRLTEHWNRYAKLLFTASVMGLVNMTGVVAGWFFRKMRICTWTISFLRKTI